MTDRDRLQRAQTDLIMEAMQKLKIPSPKGPTNLKVRKSDEYVWGYLGTEPVIGFRWVPKKGWRCYLACMVHAHADLDTFLHEAARIQGWAVQLQEAWEKYQKSRSDKNWRNYQGVVAALVTGEST